jgi:hypothetical protein
MKKTLLLFALALTFGAAAQAQVSIIPKGGLTLSTISYEKTANFSIEEEESKSTTGFVAGLGFNIPITEDGFFSVQPEVLYLQKGYRVDYSNALGSLDLEEKFNYVEVPVLGKVNFGTEKIKLYVNAGPSFGYALDGKYESVVKAGPLSLNTSGKNIFEAEPDNSTGDDAYFDPKYYNRLDIGLQFGGGIGLAVGPGAVLLDARYGLGLTNFYKGNTDNSSNADNDPNIKNRVFAFTLGYAIPLGGK